MVNILKKVFISYLLLCVSTVLPVYRRVHSGSRGIGAGIFECITSPQFAQDVKRLVIREKRKFERAVEALEDLSSGAAHGKGMLDYIFAEIERIMDLIEHDYEDIEKFFARLQSAVMEKRASAEEYYVKPAQAEDFLPQVYKAFEHNVELLRRHFIHVS